MKEELFYNKNGIIVRRSVKEDVRFLSDSLKESDVREVWASHHHTPEQALKECLLRSLLALTVQNGKPIAMFGIYTENLLGEEASIWLLSTPDLEKIQIRFLRNCKKFVIMMLDYYPRLSNYVDCRNVKTIQWLKFLGAELYEPKPYGADNMPFMRFEFRR
jgi:hypothetical protein